LNHLIEFAIEYFKDLKIKFGKGKGRKTEIRSFENIDAATVAVASQKLYVNREDGFVGTSLKKDEFVGMCSDIDDIIVFREDGKFLVTKVNGKVFVGKNVLHVDVFKKGDDRTVYNVVYRDGMRGTSYVKRFSVTAITRDKEYEFASQAKGSKILYFTANPNGEAELIRVNLRPNPKLKKASFDFDFSEQAIKGRGAKGNILSKKPIAKVVKKEDGVSTLGAIDIWFDDSVKRLNTDERGQYLGAFLGDDKIIAIMSSGDYKLYNFDLTNHFEEDMIFIEKFNPQKIMSVIYLEASTKFPYLKRFVPELTDKKINFIGESPKARLLDFNMEYKPLLEIVTNGGKGKENQKEEIDVDEFIAVKGYKAKGKRLTKDKLIKSVWREAIEAEYPEPEEEAVEAMPEEEIPENENVGEEQTVKNQTVELEIEVDDAHIIVDTKDTEEKPENKKESDQKGEEGQIELEF